MSQSVLPVNNLRGGELGDRLGTFGDGVLGELTRQDEADRGLDFAGGDRRLLVVSRELGGFGGDLFEDVVDEGVHDAHRLGGDAGVRVHLLQDLVDVDLVGLDLLLGRRLGATFDGFLCWFLAGHVACVCVSVLSNGDDDGGLSNSKKYLDVKGVVLLYIFLNFGFQCHRFFSTFALFL